MDYPDVTVLLVTYDRPQEIRQTIEALQKCLDYKGKLRWHLADDGSPREYVPGVRRDYPTLQFTATVTGRLGWGANVNKALNFIRTDYMFLCEDDYVALRRLDITTGIGVMMAESAIGLVRYDGLSAHALTLSLRELRLPWGGMQDYLLVRRDSPHLNIYSNRPHLKHRRFHDVHGLYPEGRTLGETEEAFAMRILHAQPGTPLVAALPDGIPRAFDHIGRSRQGSDQDKPKAQ